MKIISVLASSALMLAAAGSPAAAEDQHKIIATADVQWAPAPAAMPSGAIGPWGITYVNPKDDPRQSQ